ncbi:MAG TPA: helix-turn-helix transcriptional regulator [Acidimicrobiia bacterium]|nr:helix-turn-helix transcriptional regulator [Acidimicrobiia bacterium]
MSKFDPAPTLAAGIIRSVRQRADLTQAELAEAAGVTQQVVSAYETGRREPTLPALLRLVRAAGLDLRFRLTELDGQDEALAAYMDSLPPQLRTALDEAQRKQVEEARLRSVRGR